MKRMWILSLLVAVGVALGSADLLRADTAAEMLEKGIYNEETIGNLDEAIKIYHATDRSLKSALVGD